MAIDTVATWLNSNKKPSALLSTCNLFQFAYGMSYMPDIVNIPMSNQHRVVVKDQINLTNL